VVAPALEVSVGTGAGVVGASVGALLCVAVGVGEAVGCRVRVGVGDADFVRFGTT
jgi:hypothetical protein